MTRETKIAGAANEPQFADLSFFEAAIVAFGAARRVDQADLLIVADQLRRLARSPRCLPDISYPVASSHGDMRREQRPLTRARPLTENLTLTRRARAGVRDAARAKQGVREAASYTLADDARNCVMSEELDGLIRRLAAASSDRSLDHLEAEVGHAIRRRRAEAGISAAMGPVAIASVALAMALGLAAGASLVSRSVQGETVSLASELAPSSLLDG